MTLQSSFKWRKIQRRWAALLGAFAFTLATVTLLLPWFDRPSISQIDLRKLSDDDRENQVAIDVLKLLDDEESRFTNFNNETGVDNLIIPNIVHFILFEDPFISFPHFICILAAMRNQKPEKIYFHTNLDSFQGEYWARLMSLQQFIDILVIKRIQMPTEIFGQIIRPDMRIFHGGDIARIRILMEYGGIYLDNDSYIVQSLDYYRRFEIAIGWDEDHSLGTQIIVTHKDARFLKLWLETYKRTYDTNRWYYNAGVLPTNSLLYHCPELIHRVKIRFGNINDFIYKLFQEYWADWRQNYAFHLLARKKHQTVLHNISNKATYPVDFNELNLQKYPITFREMANEVLDYEKSLRSSE